MNLGYFSHYYRLLYYSNFKLRFSTLSNDDAIKLYAPSTLSHICRLYLLAMLRKIVRHHAHLILTATPSLYLHVHQIWT